MTCITLSRMSSSPAGSLTHAPTSLRRSVSNVLKGSAGNLVEWYDVYVYTVFSTYFESQFFAEDDKNSQLYVWAIFAVTFVMRPVGSWFFGWFADRHGRRAALTTSVSAMAACSFVIALTPTQATIGAWAAVILVLCRLLQGFATGGEYGASATYLSEAAVPGRRGFLSSFHYVTLVGGHVVAQTVLLIMLLAADKGWITQYGWRIAFILGGISAIAVFWARRTMDESLTTASLEASGERRSGSLVVLFGRYWRELLLCFLVTMGGTIAFYTYSVTGPKIIQKSFAGDDIITGTLINLGALIVLMLLQPLGGWISDIVGRKTLLVFFGIGGIAYTWVITTVLQGIHSAWLAFGVLIVGFVFLTGYTSINAVVKSAMFPTHVRALGVGLGYALANSAFGGTAPLLYTAAKDAHAIVPFTIYVTLAIAGSLVVYILFLRNHGANWLDDEAEMERRHDAPGKHRMGV